MKNLIPGYPKGSDLTVIDTRYHYPRKDKETGKWGKDSMTILFRDNRTGAKKHYTIYEPKYTYYILPEDKDPGYHQFFTEEKNLIKCECKYKDLDYDIAKRFDMVDQYYENISNGNRMSNSMLHANRRLFESDIGINNYYRMQFKKWYTNETIPVTKAFIDIEADTRYMHGDFPELGECPINAVSFLEYDTKKMVTVLYDDGKNPLTKKFGENLDQTKFNLRFKNLLSFALGGDEKVKSFGLSDIKTKVVIYKDELKMLYDLFRYINHEQPDFVLAWNMAFDIPYIIERIKKLGADPAVIMCDESFPDKIADYYIDTLHYNDFDRRGDYADISCSSVYIDQLIQFASRRKGQSVFQNMKLDSIGEQIAGVRKLDYSNITTNISDLPYLDYDTFVLYNMMDVVVQYCIEEKTNDIGYVFNKAVQNSTEYRKVHRQTVYLANRAITSFYEYGNYICGNNMNKFKEPPTDKYEGAFVSDPTLISTVCKDKIAGYPINRSRNAIDFDFTSLYPSITREFNLAPNTQIGYINIPKMVYDKENPRRNPKFTRSGAFLDDLMSDNFIEFAHRWFGLADFRELYEDIIQYFSTKEVPFYDIWFDLIKNKYIPLMMPEENAKLNVISDKPEPEYHPLQISNSRKQDLIKLFGGDINE